ncbi:glutathione peroxidase [Alteromonas sp. a30]|uniref:glutathione peroxidase n=1 Tax=Alteromonas sp. a30 TaxID=2730917 RepID=UPI002281C520|nr:glutathione peroxidase [Alteromonas sp. a30]MCY7296388.1 glutathione peroxidase [Alteromonas sp. a30]
MSEIYSFDVTANNGNELQLADYKGKVLLIVNTASKCGFTPQYEGLQSLYEKYKDQGFEVLAFPCDQFGHQEPGSDSDIQNFCTTRFSVSFPLFEKTEVNGDDAHPLFKYLKKQAPGIFGSEMVKWNFTKFLVGKDGKVMARYAPKTAPENIEADIKAALSL